MHFNPPNSPSFSADQKSTAPLDRPPLRFLVTGFPAFPGRPFNPTQRLIETLTSHPPALPGVELHAALLPVEYRGVEVALCRLLDEVQPDLVLSFGVGRQQTFLRLEQCGVNRDCADVPDNAGVQRSGSCIEPDGPDQRHCMIDLAALQLSLHESSIDAELSSDAGQYVCNHLLYFALGEQARRKSSFEFLFLHVAPGNTEQHQENLLSVVQRTVEWFSALQNRV